MIYQKTKTVNSMGKFYISLRLKTAKKQKVRLESNEIKGLFLWIGGENVVEWVVGYSFKRGFVADKAYHTGNHWIKDLFESLTRKEGFVRLTRFI